MVIDRLRCINCGYCAEICPKKSLAMVEGHGSPAVTRTASFTEHIQTEGGASTQVPRPAERQNTILPRFTFDWA